MALNCENGISWEAIATFTAALVALGLGVLPIWLERRKRQQQARILRVQLLHYFHHLATLLKQRTQNQAVLFDQQFQESFRDINRLWEKSDLLEPDEFQSFASAMSELIRQTRTATGSQSAEADTLKIIEATCKVLERRIKDGAT